MARIHFLILGALAAAPPAQDPAPGAAAAAARASIVRHCIECHGAKDPEADLDLERMPFEQDPERLVAVLRQMRDRVAAGEMPPAEKPRPAREDLEAIVGFARERLAALARSRPPAPGRVSMRRLSRAEYARTIRDLFGLDAVPARSFPPDDLVHGFDNQGAAATFSALHLEKLVAAAEWIAEQVVPSEDPDHPPVQRFEAEFMAGEGMHRSGGDSAHLLAAGAIVQGVHVPRAGTYRVRIRACGDQAGDEPVRMALLVQGRRVRVFEVPETPAQPGIRSVDLPLREGRNRIAIDFVNDLYQPKHPDPRQRDRNLYVDWLEVVGPVDRREPPQGSAWLRAADPGTGAARTRAAPIVRALASRAWRRPATESEVAALAALVADAAAAGDPFPRAVQLAVVAVLVSPHFLFKAEPGATEGVPGQSVALDDYQLATRLAYFLWSSMPDDALLELAAQGRLARRGAGGADALRASAERMLADARAQALASEFAGQWLEIRNVADAAPDPLRFPEFSAELRRDLATETELFFAAILREDRPVQDLLDADFSFWNERLARHYGVGGVVGEEFRRVTVPDRRRGGILGHGSVLVLTSNAARTSPVRRGKWILENLLDQAPPPPPPGNDSLRGEEEVRDARTLRARMAAHRARPECAGCHVRMDALGFALENFDAVGRWRDRDGAGAIDASGELPGGRRIDGVGELKELLRADRSFVHCVARKLFTYAIGRAPLAADHLALENAVDALPARPSLRHLILAIVDLDAFRSRAVAR
ncbi:MAG: DUF1592 domain-containing protein [Planctomycetes bacterium]|nr:DUF1592 domain-containing protein [Planctomycetota bacterium]